MQFDLIWLELNQIDLGQIELPRFDKLKYFLINDQIKLFNLIEPTR